MAYIGKTPVIGNFQVCDAITVVDAQAAYTMQVSSVNVSPESANHMLVSLNGILQAPTSSFTVSGSTLTFASNLITGDVIDFVMILGNVLDLGVPSDGTVTSAKITYPLTTFSSTGIDDNADATAITINSSENVGIGETVPLGKLHIKTGDSGQGTAQGEADELVIEGSGNAGTGVSYNTSNGRFTFGATGLYYVEITAVFLIDDSADNNVNFILQGSSDDFSASDDLCQLNFGGDGDIERNTNTGATFFNCTNTSTHKVRINYNGTSGNNLQGSTTVTKTGIRFIRLGDSQ
jgi:hypothetical protein